MRASRGTGLPLAILLATLAAGPTTVAGPSPVVPRFTPADAGAQASPEGPGRAWRLVDLASGRTLDEGRPEILDRALAPGSIVKIATLIAALEAGVITPRTRMVCPRAIDEGGRRIACVHPPLPRGLTPDEALAHSCNVFFAGVGARLPRARLDGVLAELGLPPAPAGAPAALAATGIEAAPVPPQALLRAIVRIASDPPGVNMRAPTRATVMAGLRGAARFGTAAAFGSGGVDALVKTGTALSSEGGQHGIVVAAWPAARPTRAAVVVLAGASGADAADLGVRLARDGRLPPVGPPATVAAQRTRPSAVGDAAAPGAPAVGGPPRAEVPPPAAERAQPAAPPVPPVAPVTVRVGFARGRSHAIRELPLDEYVAHVLAGEAAPRSTPAVLEALAITARTFALANRGRHRRNGFDLCDLTHCQVLRAPYPATRTAAIATAGLVLAWQGAPAQVFYTASCGGRSERPSSVWPTAVDPPFLPSRPDDGCGGEPAWSAEIAAPDLVRALGAAGFRGSTLRDMRVAGRSESGRVATLTLTGLTPDRISGQDLRMAVGRTLGWQLVKSTQFELARTARGYRFTGQGFGHGVGLCVIGATKRSAGGWSRARLLGTYFPGLSVTPATALRPSVPGPEIVPPAAELASGEARTIEAEPSAARAEGAARASGPPSPTRVRLLLPAQEERERPVLLTLAEGLLGAVTRRAGRAGPTEIQVVVHPTSQAFQRATGRPWWTSGSTRGSRIDLQPLAVLRERGILEETIAHELGHVVTTPAMRGRPLWVIEGAAMYVAGLLEPVPDAVGATSGTLACPSDAELKSPASAAAVKDAYARARSCFARALAAGHRWHEVR